ncbi:EAL domain-containing protein [Marinomonas sp. A79]|uniref:EAL domain-containing protein n=2 Tax=Marinomonas vulgaris TaxID=2823372 RepID=A0ABS5HDD8_9GAMM|nr:EAL domain-containing protein [Marinomonas vulgaris]
MIFLGFSWVQSTQHVIASQQELLLSGIARTQSAILERQLSAAFTSTQILAYEIEQNNGKTDWFDDYADTLVNSIGDIKHLQLAPDGIITDVYPEDNQPILGLDILTTPKYVKEASLSVKTQKMFIIGPIDLVQGGAAVICRVPVFLNRGTQKETFWGFASAVIYLDSLLNATRLRTLESEGFQFSLTRQHTANQKTISLASSAQPLSDLYAITNLMLPVGNLSLSISRQSSSSFGTNRSVSYLLTLCISLLLSFSLYAMLIQPLKLQKQVKEKTLALQNLAYQDSLTGLKNRRFLQDNLSKSVSLELKHNPITAFIFLDLDNFKRINDTEGHNVGDQILTIIANRLDKFSQKSDLVIRLGGDEFALLLANTDTREYIAQRSEQILQYIRRPITFRSKEYSISASIGIAMIPDHGRDLITLMQNADLAMYQAKKEGKNQYAFYNENIKLTTHNLVKGEKDLAAALQREEFEVYFQPQFNLKTNQVFAAEALVRWNHPEKGLIFPDEFIPIAERTGKIVDLGYWVLESSIAYLAQRKLDNRPDITIHINLAPAQLSDFSLVTRVKTLLTKYQVPAHLVGFEVTESTILTDVPLAQKILHTLKNMGICFSIDDFGTGYSSLSQLKQLPVNMLKIDRSFIIELESNEDDQKIVEAIIAMAHKLNIKTLAEGIETRKQWQLLEEFQCDFGQGYYVSKPITAEAFNQGNLIVHSE